MNTPGEEYPPEGHLHVHAYLALIGVAVSHLKRTPSSSIKINDSQCIRRVLTEGQVIMAEASYLSSLLSEPIGLKLIPCPALYADSTTGRGEIQVQLWSATFRAFLAVKG